MRVFVFVNQIQEIGFRQTTALLISACYRMGCEVYLSNVDGLAVSSSRSGSRASANAIPLNLDEHARSSRSVSDFAKTVDITQLGSEEIKNEDVILIRTNPGRDLNRSNVHSTFLELCQVAKAKGIRVINDPDRLGFFASKAAISVLPDKYRPEMLVTNDLQSVVQFVKSSECDCVVKPLLGSRGENVVRLRSDTATLDESLKHFAGKSIVVQHFIASQERGDKRVVVLNGELIENEGQIAGIHRIPADGDFRANLHAGGSAIPLSLTQDQREAVLAAAAILKNAGIQLAGIDLIGNKVIEFNVFSTGGIYDANQFADFDFTESIVSSMLGS